MIIYQLIAKCWMKLTRSNLKAATPKVARDR